jgi:hypothetical protein
MPTYIYECEINNIEFEDFHSITTELEKCPICEKNNMKEHKPKRLIAGGSGRGIVNLSGNELIAKTKQEVKEMKQRAGSDEKFLANVVGENRYEKNQRRR